MLDVRALYERHASDVYRWLRANMPGATREDLEDQVMETFVRAVRSAERYRPIAGKGDGKAWLFTLARRALIDRLRHERGRKLTGGLWVMPLDDTVDLVGAEEIEGDVIADLDLQVLLAQIRPARRRALTARYVDDLTLAAAAARIGCTPQAVRYAEQAGLADLRDLVRAS